MSALRKIFARWAKSKSGLSAVEFEYYSKLYDQVHDLDHAIDVTPSNTASRFDEQWKNIPTGKFLLSDEKFKSEVDTIIAEQELLIKKEWFAGKRVLDAGCGNGRWSYGFAKLGVRLTCVDISSIALAETDKALNGLSGEREFINSPLESLELPDQSFDLVFSWGVLHHCVSFNKALYNLTRLLKDGGILYLYLYGRESLSYMDDVKLFKMRVEYNKANSDAERRRILLDQAGGDPERLHEVHDLLAPTINRRFTFDEIRSILQVRGYSNITRTIKHTELFIRSIKGVPVHRDIFLAPKEPPYWFQR